MADGVQPLDDVGVDVNAVILGALREQGLIDQIAKQVLVLRRHFRCGSGPECNSGSPPGLRSRRRLARLLQVLARDDIVVHARHNLLDHGALGLRGGGNSQTRENERQNQPLAWFHRVARPPVYRFVSSGSNTFLTLSATRPRRSRRIQSVPLGSRRSPSFSERMNLTRFSGESGVSG